MNDLYKTGLGLIWLEMLYDAGYHCLDDLAAATDEELLAIPGMGPFKVRAIRKVGPVGQVGPEGGHVGPPLRGLGNDL